jgi:hypothetical protein
LGWRFKAYLERGLHPFQLAPGAARSVLENMLEKVIISDTPGYDPSLTVEDLEYLERSFILTRIFPAGTNVTKQPKVLMQRNGRPFLSCIIPRVEDLAFRCSRPCETPRLR